jgi:putative membrane protein
MWQKLSALPILAFVLFIEPLQAIAQQTQPESPQPRWYGPGPWHMGGDGYGWHSWWGGPFIMILFWLLIIAGIVAIVLFVVRGSHARGPHWGPPWQAGDRPWGDPTHSALQILNERFARGEIQKDEFEEKKAALVSGARR